MMSLNSVLMAVYFLAAFAQLSRKRFIFVFLSGAIFLTHNILDPILSDPAYYFTAALSNASCILIGKMLSPVDQAIRKLQISCLAFIILDMYGYVIWFFYMPPISYDLACTAVYLCMLNFSLRSEAKFDQSIDADSSVHNGDIHSVLVSHKNGDHHR
jgi:hypothetical protein